MIRKPLDILRRHQAHLDHIAQQRHSWTWQQGRCSQCGWPRRRRIPRTPLLLFVAAVLVGVLIVVRFVT